MIPKLNSMTHIATLKDIAQAVRSVRSRLTVSSGLLAKSLFDFKQEVGGWMIMIKQDKEKNIDKFWAFRSDKNVIRFGRIGAVGVECEYADVWQLYGKICEKLNKGYVIPDKKKIDELFPKHMLVLWNM